MRFCNESAITIKAKLVASKVRGKRQIALGDRLRPGEVMIRKMAAASAPFPQAFDLRAVPPGGSLVTVAPPGGSPPPKVDARGNPA